MTVLEASADCWGGRAPINALEWRDDDQKSLQTLYSVDNLLQAVSQSSQDVVDWQTSVLGGRINLNLAFSRGLAFDIWLCVLEVEILLSSLWFGARQPPQPSDSEGNRAGNACADGDAGEPHLP